MISVLRNEGEFLGITPEGAKKWKAIAIGEQ
jgi:hypothetical protein